MRPTRWALNAGQLDRLGAEHLLLGPTAEDPAALFVHPGGRSLHLQPVDVLPERLRPEACPVRALTDLRPDTYGPLFRSLAGKRLSRQGLLKIVRSAVDAAGLACDAASDGLPRLSDPALRVRLVEHVTRPSPTATRDLALVLNLYWGAIRGAELVAMTWADLRQVDQGVEWTVRGSKTDQLRRGETVGASRNPDPRLCPAHSLDQWRRQSAREHPLPGSLRLTLTRGFHRGCVSVN